jgi:hypothetical protein
MRSIFLAAGGLVAAASSLSVAQPARAPQRAEAAVPFAVGETLTYDVTYSSYLVAGTAISKVQDRRPSPGGPAYYIVVEGRPVPMLANLYRMYYKMDTLLDTVTLLPHRGTLHTEQGSRKRLTMTAYDRNARKASFEVHAERVGRLEFDIPPQVQDGLSALYVLRAFSIKAGDSITLPVADEGRVYQVKAEATGPERITVPLGEFNAAGLKLTITDPDGQPAAANTAVWISTDARRLPVKVQSDLPVGSFVLLLRQATS